MSTYSSVIAKMQHHRACVEEIASKSDPSRADIARADEHLAAMRQLAPRVKAAKADEQTRLAIKTIGEDIGIGGGNGYTGGSPTNTRIKALGGSTGWGDTLIRANSDPFGNFKSLTPSGQINVSVPLDVEPVRMGEPVLALRQILPTEPDVTGRFSYMRQTTRTNNAAVVAPAGLKPTSIFTLTRIDDRVRVIATLSEGIPRQDLADAAMLSTFLDTEMRLSVETALESEILDGDGTGEHFTGLANTSGVQTQAAVGTDPLATIRTAITKLEVLSLSASGIVMHPIDWQILELVQDNEGGYYMGPGLPVDRAARRLWGVPVVLSVAADQGTVYVGDFAGSTKLVVREDVVIDWSENLYDPDALGEGDGASDFARNLVRWRAEGRFGWAVTRPPGIVKVTLPA